MVPAYSFNLGWLVAILHDLQDNLEDENHDGDPGGSRKSCDHCFSPFISKWCSTRNIAGASSLMSVMFS